jgi:hypothetical protein
VDEGARRKTNWLWIKKSFSAGNSSEAVPESAVQLRDGGHSESKASQNVDSAPACRSWRLEALGLPGTPRASWSRENRISDRIAAAELPRPPAPASRGFNYYMYLRSRRLMHLEMPLPTPRLLYTANCGRGVVPKDAESMGREGKPLLDFNSNNTA